MSPGSRSSRCCFGRRCRARSRADTPVDRDLVEKIGTTPILDKSFNFQPETLTAYEIGTRVQVTPQLSFSLSAYYNVYDNLRTIETTPGTVLPSAGAIRCAASFMARSSGASYRVVDWWSLGPAFNIQHEHFRFKPGSAQIGGMTFTPTIPITRPRCARR